MYHYIETVLDVSTETKFHQTISHHSCGKTVSVKKQSSALNLIFFRSSIFFSQFILLFFSLQHAAIDFSPLQLGFFTAFTVIKSGPLGIVRHVFVSFSRIKGDCGIFSVAQFLLVFHEQNRLRRKSVLFRSLSSVVDNNVSIPIQDASRNKTLKVVTPQALCRGETNGVGLASRFRYEFLSSAKTSH